MGNCDNIKNGFCSEFFKTDISCIFGFFCGTVINNYSYEKDYAVLISLSMKFLFGNPLKGLK